MTDRHYNGPSISNDESQRRQLRKRWIDWIEARARRIHFDHVRAWSKADSGPYPSLEEARQAAYAELLVLAEALGEWCAVQPADVLDHNADRQRDYVWLSRRPRFGGPDWGPSLY